MIDPVAVALLSASVAAFCLGLWLGERGRRKDAQRREGVLRVDAVEKATVAPPGSAVPHDTSTDLHEAREKYIRETMAEVQCSRDEAAADFDKMMAAVHTESPGAGDPIL